MEEPLKPKIDPPNGAFVPLHIILPEEAEHETKTITLLKERFGLPTGSYTLVESYCTDHECDCRKVMINVIDDKSKILGTIGFGWESEKFYTKWAFGNKKLARLMIGAYLEMTGIKTERSNDCLRLVKAMLKDPFYVNRFRQHYKCFKESL